MEKKELFTAPEAEIVKFGTQDIVTASGDLEDLPINTSKTNNIILPPVPKIKTDFDNNDSNF